MSHASFWSPLTMSQREVLKIRRNNIVDKPFFPNTIVPNFPNFYSAPKEGHRTSAWRSADRSTSYRKVEKSGAAQCRDSSVRARKNPSERKKCRSCLFVAIKTLLGCTTHQGQRSSRMSELDKGLCHDKVAISLCKRRGSKTASEMHWILSEPGC